MATWKTRSSLAALFGIASVTIAQTVQECPSSDICYALSVPDETVSSGSGDIYFQLSAPTSYAWVALGQGSSMSGSNIFVMYTNSSNGVTVSPRLGTGYQQPQHDTAADIEVLEGSGVSGGVMTANVRCGNCESWSGGSMDFSSSSASWIYGWTSGSSLDSDDLDANINQHQQASSFTWDLTQARNSENVNPFSSGTSTGSDSGSDSATGTSSSDIPASCTPTADSAGSSATATSASTSASSTGTSSSSSSNDDNGSNGGPPWAGGDRDGNGHGPPWSNNDNDNDDTNNKLRRRQSNGCPAGYAPVSASGGASGPPSNINTLITAHAVLASLAFVALFPIGGILIRLTSFTGLIWVHAAIQMLAYAVYVAAFGIGVWLATNMRSLTSAHPIIGIALFVVLLGQPLSGWLHHRLFKKYSHRTLWSYVHIYHGRVAILLGMVNGGLGLRLAGAQGSSVIAYGVIAGIVGSVYIGAVVFGEMKGTRAGADSRGRRPGAKEGGQPPRYSVSEEEMEHYGPGRRN